jgi:hypothetical protein
MPHKALNFSRRPTPSTLMYQTAGETKKDDLANNKSSTNT